MPIVERCPRIALLGDKSPHVRAHTAIPIALHLTGADVELVWWPTDGEQPEGPIDALWATPGSPYASFDGALTAIRYARESGIPFLGTCGGFQHALIEYARNVLGLENADHVESNADADVPLIAPLTCSLVGQRGKINFTPGSRAYEICGPSTEANYHCSYGLNPTYAEVLSTSELRPTGFDHLGEWRTVELLSHPFFIATLFQPELDALENRLHPLVAAFVQAAIRRKNDESVTIPTEEAISSNLVS